MALNRTYLIGLGVVVALALVWFVALRPKPSSSGPAAPTSHSAPSLPGATGLAKAVAKAHATVAASEQSGGKPSTGGKAAPATAATPAGAHATAPVKSGGATSSAGANAAAGAKSSSAAATDRAARVERDLVAGKIVLIYIWNPLASDEQAVHRQLHTLNLRHGRVSLYYATPGQVASFGAITTGVQVTETPTLLIINPHGVTSTISGFTDNGSIQQAIDDAKRTGGTGAVQTDVLTSLGSGSSRTQYLSRVNRYCRKPLGANLNLQGTVRQQITTLHGILGLSLVLMNHIRSMPAPAADRAHLSFLFGSYTRATHALAGALAAASVGKAQLARSDLLQSQVLYDQATQGMADYGMTSCFPQEAR